MNPYSPTVATTPKLRTVPSQPPQRFRWQVIPSALTFFAALLSLTLAVVFVFGWLEYINSDRYAPGRTWHWTIMEFLPVPASLGTTILFCCSGWAWTHRTPTQALALLFLGFLVFVAGFALRS